MLESDNNQNSIRTIETICERLLDCNIIMILTKEATVIFGMNNGNWSTRSWSIHTSIITKKIILIYNIIKKVPKTLFWIIFPLNKIGWNEMNLK